MSNLESRLNKTNLRDLIAATGLVILLKFDPNHWVFQPVWPWNLMDDLEKWQGTSSILHQALCIFSNPSVNSNWSYSPETLQTGQNWRFFVPCDLEIRWMTLKNNRAPFYTTLSFVHHFKAIGEFQTGVTVRKRSVWVKIGNFLPRVTLNFDGWPWKTIGHLFYVASSFVHHFIAINEFKLE